MAEKNKLTINSDGKNSLKVDESNSLNTRSELSSGRKKTYLGRGYSLMDWIRLTKSTPDLAGNNGIMKKVTYEELAKHNKEDDCWLAIFDKVYNITAYMKYHPGGVDELMRGAGINATNLFNEVHPWVNIHNMLEKCLVGVLVSNNLPGIKEPSLPKAAESLQPENKQDTKSNEPKIPNLDFYQSNENLNVVLYTKVKNFQSEFLIIEKPEPLNLVLFAYILENVYKYSIDLVASITDQYTVKTSKEGKVELIFYKTDKTHWSKMNPKLNYSCESVLYTQAGVNFRECNLTKKTKITHDTDIYTFELPPHTRMRVPIGYHVFLRFSNESLNVKPYTVIDESFDCETVSETESNLLHVMIKHYDDGQFTSILNKIDLNSKIEISNFAGSFDLERLKNISELVLICAGSGFTPMIRILKTALQLNSISKIKLLFFNKTMQDILWKEKLDQLQLKYANRLNLLYVLSQAESEWNGKKGRIDKDFLDEYVFQSIKSVPLFCVCGPKLFSELTVNLLNGFNVSRQSIHEFSS